MPFEKEPRYDLIIHELEKELKNSGSQLDWTMDWTIYTLSWIRSFEEHQNKFKIIRIVPH